MLSMLNDQLGLSSCGESFKKEITNQYLIELLIVKDFPKTMLKNDESLIVMKKTANSRSSTLNLFC